MHAGILLGQELARRNLRRADAVLGLARGGVVVAAEISRILQIPLDVLVVRKIGAPGSPEFAVGAVAEDVVWWDESTIKRFGLSQEWKQEQAMVKKKEVEEYRRQLGVGNSSLALSGLAVAPMKHRDGLRRQQARPLQRPISDSPRSIILVDDGAATGISMMAAIGRMKEEKKNTKITVALPVASTEAAEKLRADVAATGEVILLEEGSFLSSVGQYYRDFSQVEWEEVRQLLSRDSG